MYICENESYRNWYCSISSSDSNIGRLKILLPHFLPLVFVSWCDVMSCHVMSCHVMSCHVMSCHILHFLLVAFSVTKSIPHVIFFPFHQPSSPLYSLFLQRYHHLSVTCTISKPIPLFLFNCLPSMTSIISFFPILFLP